MLFCLCAFLTFRVVLTQDVFIYDGTFKLYGGSVSKIKVYTNGTILFEGILKSLENAEMKIKLQLPEDRGLLYKNVTFLAVSETDSEVLSLLHHFGINSLDTIMRIQILWSKGQTKRGRRDLEVDGGPTESIRVKIDMVTVGETSLLVLDLADYNDLWASLGSEPKVKLSCELPQEMKNSFELEGFYNSSNIAASFPGVWVLKTDEGQENMKNSIICSKATQPNAALVSYNMAQASYQCNEGYESIIQVRKVCEAGAWDSKEPFPLMECYKLVCEDLRLDNRGTHTIQTTPLQDARPIGADGGKVLFFCSKNYIPAFTEGMCLDNGSWNWDTAPNGPRCNIDTSVLCPSPPQIAGTYIATPGPYPLLSTVYYHHNPGLYPNTTNLTATCNDNGVWTIPQLKCSGPAETQNCSHRSESCDNQGLFQQQYELPIVMGLGAATLISWLAAAMWYSREAKRRRRVITPAHTITVEGRRHSGRTTPANDIEDRVQQGPGETMD